MKTVRFGSKNNNVGAAVKMGVENIICSKKDVLTNIKLLNDNKYVLVLDDRMDVIKQIAVKRWDLNMLFDSDAIIFDDRRVVFNQYGTAPDSAFNYFIKLVKGGNVYVVEDMPFWVFPKEVLSGFNDILVEVFDKKVFEEGGCLLKYYLTMYNIKYKVKESPIVLNIDILDDLKMNKIGKTHTALSKNWYKNASNSLIKQLGKNMNNYFINIMKVKTIKDFFWTTYIDYIDHMPKRFKSSFVPCTMRATNDYKDRHYMCYLVNRYINPNIIKFFSSRDIKVNQEMFALSELIQWVFRSGGEDVHIYIPSKRMRDLLKGYLND